MFSWSRQYDDYDVIAFITILRFILYDMPVYVFVRACMRAAVCMHVGIILITAVTMNAVLKVKGSNVGI